jgi:excisionase family DNA binding protein
MGRADKLSYRIPEAVAATGICRSVLYELIKDGRIKTKKLGAATLIPRSELENLIDALPSG